MRKKGSRHVSGTGNDRPRTGLSAESFLSRINREVILADGGMGSLLYDRGAHTQMAFECLNLTDRETVQRAHLDYLLAGASLIETNTYGANRLKLQKCGQEDKVWDVNIWGAKIARQAREIAGESALVAGSVGSLGVMMRTVGAPDSKSVRALFREQMEALLAGGVDLFVIETMADPAEALEAIRAAREIAKLPVVVQFAFWAEGSPRSGQDLGAACGTDNDDRYATAAGYTPQMVASALNSFHPDDRPDMIGVNCSSGPVYLLEALECLQAMVEFPVAWSAMPNAGLPTYVDGRMLYSATPEYFATMTRTFVERGVRLIGGCCGTTPNHIVAMKRALDQLQVSHREPGHISCAVPLSGIHHETIQTRRKIQSSDASSPATSQVVEPEHHADSGIYAKLGKQFFISVELDPPKGSGTHKFMESAKALKQAGVDSINVADSPMARVRMGAIASAHLIQDQTHVETIVHLTTRDRNLMGLQSDLLGAHALGIRNILALTGDPPSLNAMNQSSPVYDVDSIGLIKVISELNAGRDIQNNPIGQATEFTIGCALNPNAENLERELERFRQKLDAGAHFVMTQPIYDLAPLYRVLDTVGECPVPIILGVMPLHSYKHAVYLHNEVPGITIPEPIRNELMLAGDDGLRVGLTQAEELVMQASKLIAGIYVVLSFGKHEPVCAFVEQMRAHVGREHA